MARSKYPSLNRLLKEVQEITGVSPVDGLIGPNTERALAETVRHYDGNDILGYLSDKLHRDLEHSPSLVVEPEKDDPSWLTVARTYIGLEEIVGSKHNDEILEFWKLCHLPFKDDETPWCAGFVGGVLEKCGIISTRSGMARSYLKWGVKIENPVVGCVVVFWRGHINSPHGHVAFCGAPPTDTVIPALGGNQGNKVCIKPYPRSRVLGFRMPVGMVDSVRN